jgi:hypothetical protein
VLVTLILTLLANQHIVQVADRRLTLPDGSIYDDDTNKAVFYCGRVAVAYTGLALIEAMATAEWIGLCMKDFTQTEAAMHHIADRAESYLQSANVIDKRIAVIATGWATSSGKSEIYQFISVASNFMTDSWEWGSCRKMKVRTRILDDASWHLFFAGQAVYPGEVSRLSRLLNRAFKRGATIIDIVRLLQRVVHSVASRNSTVGKGMITHLLSRKAAVDGRSLIVTPLSVESHSFLYTSKEGRSDRFQGAVIACNGALLTNFGGGTILPSGRSIFEDESKKPKP